MKKLILFVSLMTSFNLFAQTIGGTPGSAVDYSNNPSGQAFGGAMGGGNVPSSSNTPTNLDMGVPRGNELPQQRMEDNTSNFTGGSMGGDQRTPSTTVPPTSLPADTPVAPSVPDSNVTLPRQNGTTSPTSP